MAREETWALEPHLCRDCGGRIMRRVGGPAIMTAGGNPMYRCVGCGKGRADMGCSSLCWCGYSIGGSRGSAYTCQPFSVLVKEPYLREGFLAFGCDPARGEVGVMLQTDLARLRASQTPFEGPEESARRIVEAVRKTLATAQANLTPGIKVLEPLFTEFGFQIDDVEHRIVQEIYRRHPKTR